MINRQNKKLRIFAFFSALILLNLGLMHAELLEPDDLISNSTLSLGNNPASAVYLKRAHLSLGAAFLTKQLQNSKILNTPQTTGTDWDPYPYSSDFFQYSSNILPGLAYQLKYQRNILNFQSYSAKYTLTPAAKFTFFNQSEGETSALGLSFQLPWQIALGLELDSSRVVSTYGANFNSYLEQTVSWFDTNRSSLSSNQYNSATLGLIKEFEQGWTLTFAQRFSAQRSIHQRDYSKLTGTATASDYDEPVPNYSSLALIKKLTPAFQAALFTETSWGTKYSRKITFSDGSSPTPNMVEYNPYNIYGLALEFRPSAQLKFLLSGDFGRYVNRNYLENGPTANALGMEITDVGFSCRYFLNEDTSVLLGLSSTKIMQEDRQNGTFAENQRAYFAVSHYFDKTSEKSTSKPKNKESSVSNKPESTPAANNMETNTVQSTAINTEQSEESSSTVTSGPAVASAVLPDNTLPVMNQPAHGNLLKDSDVNIRLSEQRIPRSSTLFLVVDVPADANIAKVIYELNQQKRIMNNRQLNRYLTEINIPRNFPTGIYKLKVSVLTKDYQLIEKTALLEIY